MTREEKSVAINEILEVLKSNQNIYLADISGLNALETSNLRRMCFKAGVKLSVVKNTLLEKAMDDSEKDFGELKETLKGNTSVMIAEVSSAPAKVIKNFRKKSEKPVLKGAMIEEDIYIGDDQIEALFNLKSKEEVIGEIITLLQSPAKNVISALKSSSGKIAGLVKTLSENPIEGEKAEEPAAEEAKAEEPAAEEVKAEEPAAEEAKVEEPAAEENKSEEQTSEDESNDESK